MQDTDSDSAIRLTPHGSSFSLGAYGVISGHLTLLLLGALAIVVGCSAAAEGAETLASPLPWIVDARNAREMVSAGALVVDARAHHRGTIKHAVQIDWRDFSPSRGARRGVLLEPALVARRLRALGVRRDRPVVVFGDPLGGWGEEGRIVWMLRTLGHRAAAMVDGGYRALREAGITAARPARQPGDFVAHRPRHWWIDREGVKRRLLRNKTVFVDARERREFEGATPYGERRGGHLPGAVHLYYRTLIDARGRLLSKRRLRARLRATGITADRSVVAFCSGGVRSAWLVAVLVDLSYKHVMNYPGSMWEWSAGSAKDYPLER